MSLISVLSLSLVLKYFLLQFSLYRWSNQENVVWVTDHHNITSAVLQWTVDVKQQIKETKLNESRHEKTNILVSNLARLKPGCTATEDG